MLRSENATLVSGLLVDLRERGLDVTRPMLVGIDGSQGAAHGGARRARPPGDPTLSTAQEQKCERLSVVATRSSVGRKMTDAYHAASALEAEAALLALAKELDHTHPGAAASLRETLEDTLTVLR